MLNSSKLNFAIVEIVLMLRVWALYDRSKRVGAFLVTLFVVGLSASFALGKLHPQVPRTLQSIEAFADLCWNTGSTTSTHT
jgi:hypothetical protein